MPIRPDSPEHPPSSPAPNKASLHPPVARRRARQQRMAPRQSRRVEAALRASEERYRGLLASLDSVVAALDETGRILYVNERAGERLGSTPQAMIGQKLADLLPEPFASAHLDVLRTVFREALPQMLETQSLVFGLPHWYRISLQPIHDEQGRVAYVLVNATDIHDLKLIQQELQELNQTLEARVARRTAEFQDLYEHAPNGYHSLDIDGNFLMINQTELDWLGYAREELIGRHFTSILGPQSQSAFADNFSRFKQRGWVKDLDFELRRKDGTIFPVLINGTAIYDLDGDFVMSRSTVFDNTDRKYAEQALRLANVEMERALRTKDEFLANMSHELRTPLNAVLALSESLIEGVRGPLSPAQQGSLRQIESSGRHLLDLINDILDLSKIEAGRLDLQIEPVSVADLCRTSLQFIKELALKKHLQISFRLNDELAQCYADPRRLKQMLVNLLSNAVKFTPTGGKISLAVEVSSESGLISFIVRDTGIGIAPAELPRLFQPFTQLDSSLSRQHEGSGLGLALVRRLAQMHGGSVVVESEPGQGSCFTITLPYYHAEPGRPTADAPTHLMPPLHTVLVIEDSASAVEQLTRYLHELHVQTVVHTHASQAINLALSLHPDLILLDLLMPDRSGWEILAELKLLPETCTIPVIVTSVVDEQTSGLLDSTAGYLVKPISRERLHQAMAGLIPPLANASVRSSSLPAPVLLLLAEDNEVNLEVVRDYLQAKGFAVAPARNGYEAINQARLLCPALIVMDIQMPELDGLSAIQRLRADATCATIPIIALTALAMPGDRDRCLAAGASVYLTKPVSLKDLVATIHQLLDLG